MEKNLVNSTLFKGIDMKEIEKILSSTHHQIKAYEKETIIAQSGDICNKLFILIEGSVRGEVSDYTGKLIKIEDINAPDSFAEAFIYANENMLLVNIVTNSKTKILTIYENDLFEMFLKHPTVLKNYLTILSDRFVLVTKKLKFLSLKSIKGKLAQYLLKQSKQNNSNKFVLDKTQQELADYFGITRPSLTRSIKELDKLGFISAKGKNIEIVDKHKLMRHSVVDEK
ncbi:MAG: Crp/Fnr family transcriptional regulator [Bacteroidetes bacterium]|jgi:CRP/FNR family transcriptional regulator, dissimilatory nitrate respiration regulator|nr:Crp/Fnr family transcriptional regulator [Bacteroidota bacterium]MBT6685433.1 Crp/Fnr family transcriptional regulator [Bacteroidota bacterium]MBT7143802.1 Crp/Fnr family transcriptional regulator [Bacteroidota bacterium]MBT7490306.1 Crp/Fnr family transcriptional regulator [Bacteroidota bacterium]